MSAQIIQLVTDQSVDAAWQAYVQLAARAVAEPSLLLDREFFDEMTLREARYKRLFLARERAK